MLEGRLLLTFGSCATTFAWLGGATGTTVSVTLTAADDILIAKQHVVNGTGYLGIWNGGIGAPCWNSHDDLPAASRIPAASLTRLEVNAQTGHDLVDLSGIHQLNFPSFSEGAVYGFGGNDTIKGSWAGDYLDGYLGDDFIEGKGGDDTIYAGGGKDVVMGGAGEDFISGEEDDDLIEGNADNDTINGGDGNDWLHGGAGDDYLSGDNVGFADGHDVIEGQAGNDQIDGGGMQDILSSNIIRGPVDQPWNSNGQGTAGWFDMHLSGPDDGACDLEDGNPDDEVGACAGAALVARNDTYSVWRGVPAPGMSVPAPGMVGNDTRALPPAPPEVLNQLIGPFHGTLAFFANHAFKYDPDDSYVGTDIFFYSLTQSGVTSAPAMVTFLVTNAIPQANNDGPITVMGATPVVINVITNPYGADTDADAYDDLDISAITDWPDKGQIQVDYESGQVTYTYTGPPGQFTSDTFRYKVTDGWDESNEATVAFSIYVNPLLLDRHPVEASADTKSISNSDLALLAEEAARRLVLAGVNPVTAQKALDGTEFLVDDLPESVLGAEMPGKIVIDLNAAGYGWFVDATPSLDEEFNILVAPSERQAGRGSPAFGHVDVLTVLMHEFGHAIGMVHLEGGEFEHSVMHDTLGLSMRRVPTPADILAADEFYATLGNTIKRRRW